MFEDSAQLGGKNCSIILMLRGMYICMVELLGMKPRVVVKFWRMLIGDNWCIFFNSSSLAYNIILFIVYFDF